MSLTAESEPTTRQLTYLRALANATGTTFLTPRTRGQASREISRLRQLKAEQPLTIVDEPHEHLEVAAYATALAADEVSGYGSNARFRRAIPPMRRPLTRTPPAGARTELARYTLTSGVRVLHGERAGEGLKVTDSPADGEGASFLVEAALHLESYPALQALIADYTQQARDLDDVPMASTALAQLLRVAHA